MEVDNSPENTLLQDIRSVTFREVEKMEEARYTMHLRVLIMIREKWATTVTFFLLPMEVEAFLIWVKPWDIHLIPYWIQSTYAELKW